MRLFESGAHRASKLIPGAGALILAGLLIGAGGSVGAPAVVAAAKTPAKVVIVVGPTGSGTAGNIAEAKRLAAQARGYGANVIEVYSPNATWSRVSAAIQGANILIDMGHGNGWPSPYSPYQENTKDGLGLNSTLNDGNNDLKYYGANWLRKYIHLAPGAVVILHGLCYSAGNSEPGNPNPSVEVGRERIENFAAGYLSIGARAVFAEPGGDVGYILSALFAGSTTARKIFTSESVTTIPMLMYPSHRTASAHLFAQRDRTFKFRRSVAGFLDTPISAAP